MTGTGQKLRFRPPGRPFHVVLVEPEIPPNTGNVGRLCAATGSHLHLVGKLGFDIGEKAVRRAGLDYWNELALSTHSDLETFIARVSPPRLILFSSVASRSYLEAPYEPGSALVLGGESSGLPRAILDRHADCVHAIPTRSGMRSLNLANAAAIVLYEALRVTGALGASFQEPV